MTTTKTTTGSATYHDFAELLAEPRHFAAFMGLSAVLVDREPLEAWLGIGYFATLVAGALQSSDFAAHQPRTAFAERLSAYLGASRHYRDTSGVPLARTVEQLLPDGRYARQYTVQDIKVALRRFADLALVHPDRDGLTEAVKRELLRDDGPGTAARSCLVLWYAAGLLGLNIELGYMTKAAPIQTYSSALVWDAVSGNPMGITGAYYGSWAYPPPRPILPPER